MKAWIFGLIAMVVVITLLLVSIVDLLRNVLRKEALRDTRNILTLSASNKLEQVKSSGLAHADAVEYMQELQKSFGTVEDFKIVDAHVGPLGLPIIIKASVTRKGVVAYEYYSFHTAVTCHAVSRQQPAAPP